MVTISFSPPLPGSVTRRFLDTLLLALVCALGFSRPAPIPYIAHAGGGLRGYGARGEDLAYTNALEALDRSYGLGHRVFEVDFSWTSDDALVALHDWEASHRQLFGGGAVDLTRASFLAAESVHGLTHLDLDGVMSWLARHGDARLVTDIKEDNVRGLERIAARYPALVPRIIPQVYAREEYRPVRDLGYADVIFTLYRSADDDPAVIAFAAGHPLYAVTMPIQRAYTGLASALGEIGIRTYAHTVNEPALARRLLHAGVDGFYTDYLTPVSHGGR